MKKSMFALFGCALVAGSVMAAASVDGNNTAVVIQKDPVATSNNYQFLIVPVKGFDIANGATEKKIPLKELLPPTLYPAGTVVYAAAGDDKATYVIKDVNGNGNNIWTPYGDSVAEVAVEYAPRTPFWLQTNGTPENSTVFCGELLDTDVTITPVAGTMQLIGNATSTAVKIKDINCGAGSFLSGDTIFALKAGSSDYDQYIYSTTKSGWTKTVPGKVQMQKVEDTDVFPAGAAAYFYRKATATN